MKVLTFLTSLSLRAGGPSRSVPLLVKGLSELGVDVTLMTYRSEDMNTHALDGTSAKLIILEKGTSFQEIESRIINEGFEIIQIQSIWDLRYHLVERIARRHHIPYIITPRGMLEPWSLTQSKLKKRIALWCYQRNDLNKSACIYTTAEMEAIHIKELGITAPVAIVSNGVETDEYSRRTSNSDIKKQVLFISRLHPKKGIELLIETWSRIHNDFPDWSLLITGNGELDYINGLKDKIVDWGLSESATILPPVYGKEKYYLYCESALFCLPSYSENFGMVIAEALSCGVPVITTNNTPWSILNNYKGERIGWCIDLCPTNLENTLREAMSTPLEQLFLMGQKGSKMIESNYNYHSVAKKTLELYGWLLSGRERPEFVSYE